MPRLVARPLGVIGLGMAAIMGLIAALAVLFEVVGFSRGELDDGAWIPALAASGVAGMVGGGLSVFGRAAPKRSLRRNEAMVTVTSVWVFVGFLGALPYLFGSPLGPFDALFESVSGLTTTGATVVGDIEGTLSRPILLWRSFTQWLGGMGIVVLMVAVLPNLGVGGKHMFRQEVPGHTADGLVPRITETSIVLWRIYAGMTLVVFVTYMLMFRWVVPSTRSLSFGECVFEAICHAFTTMSTGGFSTRDDSIGAFDHAGFEVIVATFCLVSGVNFAVYYGALVRRQVRTFFRSLELRVYIGVVALFSLLVGMSILPLHDWKPLVALRHAYFTVASMITSTGYGIDNYMAYPPFALGLLIIVLIVGASGGSTSGGIKLSRIILLVEETILQLRRSVRPSLVQVVRLDGRTVPDGVIAEVTLMIFVYVACLFGGVLLLGVTDATQVPTAFGAMVSTLSNMGPAPFYEEVDNFARYSPTAKVWFSIAMIVGRLEFFTVLALLLPDVWRR